MKLSPKVGAALRRGVGAVCAVLTDGEVQATRDVLDKLNDHIGMVGMLGIGSDRVAAIEAVFSMTFDAVRDEWVSRLEKGGGPR